MTSWRRTCDGEEDELEEEALVVGDGDEGVVDEGAGDGDGDVVVGEDEEDEAEAALHADLRNLPRMSRKPAVRSDFRQASQKAGAA